VSSPKKIGGLELGHYISRSIVEALDGRSEVERAPERGSRFTVALPVR
jgi:signal transduction histidine kinase